MLGRFLCTGMLIVSMPLAAAQEGVKEWLDKMAAAEQYLNYEGTFIYTNGPQVETMQIVHGFDKHGERERMSSLTGDVREIIRDDQHLVSVLPVRKKVLIESRGKQLSSPAKLLEGLEQSEAYYEYGLKGTERIAGHNCQILTIYPKDNFRYGYRLCIEMETGILLKSLTQDHAGQTHEQMMFTSISMPESIATDQFHSVMHKEDFDLKQSPDTLGVKILAKPDRRWVVGELPPGFRITEDAMRQIASSKKPVQHIIIDDGLASLSVFIAPPQKDEQVVEGIFRSGGLNASTRLYADHAVTVIGEVPVKTVRFIAESIRYDQ